MRIAVAALIMILGGCGDSAPDAAATPEATGTFVAEAGEPALLALRPDGLSLLAVGSTRAEGIPFGTTRAAAEAAAQAAFPGVEPTLETNGECPAGPMEFATYGTLSLNFQDGQFVGWFAREGAGAATIDGIQPGVTRAELESERSVQLDTASTIPGMFTYFLPDDTFIGGLLEGEGAGAKVTALYSGTNCFFT